MTYLSKNLKYLREKHDYSQEDLSKLLYLTHQTISNHEIGKSEPSLDSIQKYADFYQVKSDDLIYTDLSKEKKNMKVIYDGVIFDKKDKTMIILKGTKGTYDYRKIKKCSVLNEEAKYRGKTIPFLHQVLGGVTFYSYIGEPALYVGLKLVMEDNTILGIYVSDTKTVVNSDIYRNERKIAFEIKQFVDKIIQKYSN